MSRNLSPAIVFTKNYRGVFYLLFSTLVLSMSSCIASRMVPQDMQALAMGKELKTEALNLMGMATESYTDHAAEVTAFKDKVNTHIAYEEARGEKNKTTVDMWKTLMKPESHLLGGFLSKWKSEGTLNQVFVTQIQKEVGENFSKIISLEGKKKKG